MISKYKIYVDAAADIPADVIARKLIEGFGLDAILKEADAD